MTFKYGITPSYSFDFVLNYCIILALCFSSIYFFLIYLLGNRSRKYLTISELTMAIVFLTSFFNGWGTSFFHLSPSPYFDKIALSFISPVVLFLFLKFLCECNDDLHFEKFIYFSYIVLSIYIVIILFLIYAHPAKIPLVLSIVIAYLNILSLYVSYKVFRAKKDFSLLMLFCTATMIATTCIDFVLYITGYRFYSMILISYILFVTVNLSLTFRDNAIALQKAQRMASSYNKSIQRIKQNEKNFLSSHLKAHFLFNALNIIGGYVYYDKYKSQHLTHSLKIYMQQLFDHESLESSNTLANEINLAVAFAYIEMERFNNLNINFDITGMPNDKLVPPLILQPLIENAVNHGARKKDAQGAGNITVRIVIDNYYSRIEIEDDGAGCEEEVLYNAINNDENNNYHSLYHIGHCLKINYNEKIHFKSVIREGTKISFKIPVSYD